MALERIPSPTLSVGDTVRLNGSQKNYFRRQLLRYSLKRLRKSGSLSGKLSANAKASVRDRMAIYDACEVATVAGVVPFYGLCLDSPMFNQCYLSTNIYEFYLCYHYVVDGKFQAYVSPIALAVGSMLQPIDAVTYADNVSRQSDKLRCHKWRS